MDAKDVLRNQLASGDNLIEMFSQDFSDEEYLYQLPNGGQTTLWIIGHLAVSEDWMLSKISRGEVKISPEMHEKFQGGTAPTGNAEDNPSIDEVKQLFKEQRERTLAALDESDTDTWENESPEDVRQFFPTIGGLWSLMATHEFWHFGQLSVIRRNLEKPSALGM